MSVAARTGTGGKASSPSAGAIDSLRYLGAALTLVVGLVHLQQYLDFISEVPTIGVLFLLNAAGAGAIVALLATPLRALAALGGIALSIGSLVAIVLAMTSGLFDYIEPTLRTPVLISILAEAGAVLALAAYLLKRRRTA